MLMMLIVEIVVVWVALSAALGSLAGRVIHHHVGD